MEIEYEKMDLPEFLEALKETVSMGAVDEESNRCFSLPNGNYNLSISQGDLPLDLKLAQAWPTKVKGWICPPRDYRNFPNDPAKVTFYLGKSDRTEWHLNFSEDSLDKATYTDEYD